MRGGATGERTWVALPPDIDAIRAADPALGREWRLAVRETLGALLGVWRIEGFTRDGRYALGRGRP